MKKCGIKSETLVDYIYGEIEPGGDINGLEAHISGCPGCRAELERLRAVREAGASLKVDFSADVWNMQRSAIMKELKKKKKTGMDVFEFLRGKFPAGAILAAALILMVAGAVITFFYHAKAVEQQRTFAEKSEMLQNLDVIERLDFYEKISEN
jgi:anti-sigma factor RsiW